MGCQVREYWASKHLANDKSALTGTSLQQYCEFFGLTPQAFENQIVLEIGVGMGKATRSIAMLTDYLDVLDICDIAIIKVLNWVEDAYIDPRSLDANKYDIVISYLVAQHMGDEDFLNQLKNVIRALKPTGVFYLQFAEARAVNPETFENKAGGGMVRYLEQVEQIVQQAGGSLEVVKAQGISSQVTFYGVKVRKA